MKDRLNKLLRFAIKSIEDEVKEYVNIKLKMAILELETLREEIKNKQEKQNEERSSGDMSIAGGQEMGIVEDSVTKELVKY